MRREFLCSLANLRNWARELVLKVASEFEAWWSWFL